MAPAPVPILNIPAAVVTPVGSGEDLQKAAQAPARDIEIRAHLDLRGLEPSIDPTLGSLDYDGDDPALIYAFRPLRSIRGNCSDPDAAAALGLSPAEARELLPLKPFQCLVIVDQPFLKHIGGDVLVDNLYLQLRRDAVWPGSAFISTLPYSNSLDIGRSGLYVTAVTFHAAARGSTRGISLFLRSTAALVSGCIFTGWRGAESPLIVNYGSLAHVHDTVFHDTHLAAELIDVSFDGTVRFSNVSLANVTLDRGAVVSTSNNDYAAPQGAVSNFVYYAEDDEAYDVDVEPVPAAAAGVFGAEFGIADAVMSDCVFLAIVPRTTVMPGCPEESALQRARILARFDGAEDDEALLLRIEPVSRLRDDMLAADDEWLVRTVQVLPAIRPVPDSWPPFVLDPPPQPGNRSSLMPEPTPASATLWGAFTPSPPPVPLPAAVSPAAAPVRPPGSPQREPWVVPLLIVLICTTLLGALAALWCFMRLQRRRRGAVEKVVDEEAAGQRAHHDGWRTTQAAAGSAPVRNIPTMSSAPSPRAPGDAASYAAAMFTQGGTVSVSDADFDLFPPLVGLDSMASMARAGSAVYSSLPRDGSRPQGSVSFGISLNGDPSLRQEKSVPDSALNPAYDYALPPWLALIAPQPEVQGTERLYEPSEPSVPLTDDTAASAADAAAAAASQQRQPPAGLPPALALHHGAHTLMAAAAAAGMASAPGNAMARMTEPARGPASMLRQPSLDARSDTMSGSTIVMSPFTDVYSTHSTHSTDVYVPPVGATHIAPCAIPEHAEVPTNDLQPAASGASRAVVTEASTQHSTTRTLSTAYPDSQSNLGLSTTDALLADESIRMLLRQLDCFRERHLFLGKFVMLGRVDRRRGGQAVVQFCRNRKDSCHYAVKFFLDHSAFVTEAALYAACFPGLRSTVSPDVHVRADATIEAADSDTSLSTVPLSQFAARFLPQVEAVCDGATAGLVDPRGRPLPPCIIMEKGESLQDWSERAQPDLFTALAVLSNISQRLADMHDAGYVHRDLKPANVMWLPRENRWTVIDFGCVARVGEKVGLSFTLAYAAPEVVAAVLGNEKKMLASPALDAWSLGVMAFELLTGSPAFKMVTDGRFKVVAMLKGEFALPWEGELDPEVQRQLGAFRGLVLQLLQRNPRRRVSLRHFHRTCTRLFDSRTTIQA